MSRDNLPPAKPKLKAERHSSSPARKVCDLVPALLAWFAHGARDLPWRRTRDPYAIWVSEIMLQQTQVKTVIPYWERWMHALPEIRDLAEATPETIHKLWEGLGYYTRVRNLQKASRQIIANHNGQFPRDHEAILDLPGIGRYTAGAISSIAFNEPTPILDGNVIRVLTRLFGIATNPREKSTNEKLWRLAEQPVLQAHATKSESACSHLNQSLMELGAIVCTPKQPNCPQCPVQRHCTARRTGRVDQLPNLGARAPATARRFAAFVIERRGHFLVRQRPAGVVNAHLWEFPNMEISATSPDLKVIAKKELGLALAIVEKLCVIKHTITRYRITLEAWRAKIKSPLRKSARGITWLTPAELNNLAFTSAHRKILDKIAP